MSYAAQWHIGRLLKRLNWSPQKPAHRPSQRDEVVIERWRAETWEAIKKSPAGRTNDRVQSMKQVCIC